MSAADRSAQGQAPASAELESALWQSAELLRGRVEPGAYKHAVLGLLFLRAASAEGSQLCVPADASWEQFSPWRGAPEALGAGLDAALRTLEQANPRLSGALPPRFVASLVPASALSALVARVDEAWPPDHAAPADTLGRAYEYFLARFARQEGRGGEYYTPPSVVSLLVGILAPSKGVVYDPCCGSGGLFVQSAALAGPNAPRLRFVGQESNPQTRRLAAMNLALRGVEADLGARAEDTLARDLFADLRADAILANPPFNVSGWARDPEDPRWHHGVPPLGNANFAWVQHIDHHLSARGEAAFVLANGSLTTAVGAEAAVRQRLVEADRVDAIVALPSQLFYATPIPACVWVLAADRSGRAASADAPLRDRRGEVLFIDARGLGRMATRTHRVLDSTDVDRIVGALRRWRAPRGGALVIPGLARGVAVAEIAARDFDLAPGRYVAPEVEADNTEDRPLTALAAEVLELQRRGAALDARIERALAEWSGEA